MGSDGRWVDTTWGEIAELRYGKALKGYRDRAEGFPVYGTNGPVGYADKPLASGPAVVVGRKGAYRGVHLATSDFWVIDTAFWLDPKRHVVDPRWAYYSLKATDINSRDSGSAIPSLSRPDFYAIRVSLPPMEEQRAIAEVLGALDDRIEWCATLKSHLHALGESYLESTLAEVGLSCRRPVPPDRAETLGEWISVLESGSRPRGGVKGIVEGVPSVGAESITRVGDFDYNKTKFVPRDFFERMRRGHVEDMDVLVYKDGGRPGVFVPHVSLAGSGFPFDEFAINDHVYRVRVKAPYNQAFVYFWLSTPQSIEEMARRGTGAAQPGLSQANFKQVPLPVLGPAALTRLEELLTPTLRAILHFANEQRALSTTRDALLPRLLSGELRIEDPGRVLGAVA